MSKFSVVMATYNRSHHILASIRSVLDQKFDDFELLVIGDGCTDDTPSILSGLDPRVSFENLSQRCGSQSFPNNRGIEKANGDHIAYIGHDDIWEKNHLSELWRLFEQDTALDFAVSGAIFHLPPGVKMVQATGLFNSDSDKFIHFFPPSSIAHRRDVAEKSGFWREPKECRAPVDADFMLRAAANGATFCSTQKVTVHKFAAGHRYLSYVAQESDEQNLLINKMSDDNFGEYRSELIERARKTDGYMAVRHADYQSFEAGELARLNAINKSALRPELKKLWLRTKIELPAQALAVDWKSPDGYGIRWASLNPQPKLMLPFTGTNRAEICIKFVHPNEGALDNLIITHKGNHCELMMRQPATDGKFWLTDARLDVELSATDPVILKLRLNTEAKIGFRDISIKKLTRFALFWRWVTNSQL